MDLDDQIHPNGDVNEFSLELSSFLKELSCPYTTMTSGPLNERFSTIQKRQLLIDYLSSELMAAKMSYHLNPEKRQTIEVVSFSNFINFFQC